MIVVDTREPGEIAAHLVDMDCEIERRQLPVGDFIVADRIIERKEYNDLLGRLTQNGNSLFFQLHRMTEAADEESLNPELLLEGCWHKTLKYRDMSSAFPISEIAGITKMGVSTVHTPNLEGTAQYLRSLETKTTSIGDRALRDPPTVPDDQIARHLVEGFEGVGPKTSRALLDRFGSLQGVATSEVSELSEVEGVGSATAARIYGAARAELPDA